MALFKKRQSQVVRLRLKPSFPKPRPPTPKNKTTLYPKTREFRGPCKQRDRTLHRKREPPRFARRLKIILRMGWNSASIFPRLSKQGENICTIFYYLLSEDVLDGSLLQSRSFSLPFSVFFSPSWKLIFSQYLLPPRLCGGWTSLKTTAASIIPL